MLAAFCLRWGLALLLPNIYRPDEIFQTLEPAFRLWSGGGIVTWEWRAGIRSPMFPGFLAGLMVLSSLFGWGAAGYLAVIAGMLSLLATAVVAVGFLAGWRRAGWPGALLCGVICASWPDLVYFGPKPLTEVQAGNLLVIAAYLAATHDAVGCRSAGRMLAIGMLLGLVFSIRFHLAPAILLVAIWSARRNARRWLVVVSGFAIPLAALGIIDFLYWGNAFQSILRNYEINIVEGVSREWGALPVYWYLGGFIDEWGAAIIPVALAFVAGARRAPLFAGLALVVLLSHHLVAHKEMSFVYAALPPALIVAGLGTLDIARRITDRNAAAPAAAATAAAAAGLWIAISLTTSLSGEFRALWSRDAATLQAEAALRHDPALCGLGLRGPHVTWWHSGGDSHIGRPVPIYAFASDTADQVAPAIDAALGDRDVAKGLPGFDVKECWDDPGGEVCLAKIQRPSGCTPIPALDVNNERFLGR